jgi:hypothetical protein
MYCHAKVLHGILRWRTQEVASAVTRLIGGETRALEITRRNLNVSIFKVESEA